MDSLTSLRKEASRFPAKDLAKAAGLSRAYVTELIKGDKTNPSLVAFEKLQKGVAKLKNASAKKFSSGKADKKQTQSRDKSRRSVAGKGA